MKILTVKTGPIYVNTYIVTGDDATAVVIDPGSADEVLTELKFMKLRCTHILLTHGHFDHILGVKRLKDATGAQICINELEADTLKSDRKNLGVFSGFCVEKCSADTTFCDNFEFDAAGLHFRAILTPGHSAGSSCYIIDDERTLFSGDTLFRLSIGRTDLPGGDARAILDSISYRLYTLSGDYRVLPGHEGETTLDLEREHNPYTLRGTL